MAELCAVEYIRRMGGGSQSHLIRASDDRYYIIKVQNNPQGVRVLANEMLGSSLAALLQLPSPKIAVINVCEKFIRYTQDMIIQLQHGSEPCQAGLCCGSEFNEHAFIFLPNFFPPESLENPEDILGMLVFDKWTSNSDRRQLMFYRARPAELHRVIMIDQGDCFCRDKWTFLDDPAVGLCDCSKFYQGVKSLQDFEPWLYALENEVTVGMMRKIAARIPHEWYRNDHAALDDLVLRLNRRRMVVRGLLKSTLRLREGYFPRLRSGFANSEPRCLEISGKDKSRCTVIGRRRNHVQNRPLSAY
ncbi:MAG TPA: HipA family kinase [Candidatus Acidoferrales bacterium]|nr:HipA family kinase [Candidatus Acidoferrales bacterium]